MIFIREKFFKYLKFLVKELSKIYITQYVTSIFCTKFTVSFMILTKICCFAYLCSVQYALCINNLLCLNMYVFCPSKVTLLFRPDVNITYLVLKIASLFQDLFKSLAPGFMWEENLLCHDILMKGRNLKYAVVCY